MATIKDVAKEAGVSVATVSRVINKSPKASKSSIAARHASNEQTGLSPKRGSQSLSEPKHQYGRRFGGGCL